MTIRLAVVDDSAFVRKAIARMMESEGDVEVVGVAATGEELIASLVEWNPSIVTLDLSMPGMGGLATLDGILAWRRIPVVILSGHSTREAPLAVEALHRGAADFIDKQEFSLVDFDRLRSALLERIRLLVLRTTPARKIAAVEVRPALPPVASEFDAVIIGASTGGPPAIERLLEAFDAPPPVPFVVAQHMPTGFTAAFAQRLDGRMPYPVNEVTSNRRLTAGTVWIAPAGMHLRIVREQAGIVASLTHYPEAQHRPSVDVLFRSASALAPRVIAVLLTGMGDDGARAMLELEQRGAMTIAQDEASCVVYGMPRAAVELGAVREELPLPQIAERLRQLLRL